MPDTEGAADLERLLAEHGERLMRTAVLLAGSHQDGQDLLQGALERLLRTGRSRSLPRGCRLPPISSGVPSRLSATGT